MKKLALPLTIVALGAFSYACSGGGGGGGNQSEPCCAAQGQTIPPSSGFAGGGVERHAQAIFVDVTPDACPDIDAGLDFDSIILSNASDVEDVAADGTFQLELYGEVADSSSVGQLFFVRVFDGSGSGRVDRGLGALSKKAVDGETIPVAPILFGADTIGESTLEMVVACRFAIAPDVADQFQGMTFNDVRAFVDGGVTDAFNSTTGIDRVLGVRDQVKNYRHGINGMVAALTTSNQPVDVSQALSELTRLRDDAELLADRCKLGLEPGLEGCATTPVDPRRAEAYRFWHMFRNYDQYTIPLGLDIGQERLFQIFAAWNDDVLIRLLSDFSLDAGYETAAYKQNQIIRLELAHSMLRRAYLCYGDADGDTDGDGLCEGTTVDPTSDVVGTGTGSSVNYESLEGPGGAVETLRAVILDPTSGQSEIATAWGDFANDVVFNFGLQANPALYSDDPAGTYAQGVVTPGVNNASAARNDMLDGCNGAPTSDWSNDDIRQRLFEASNRCGGTQNGPRVVVDNAVIGSFGTADPGNASFVADAVFWAVLNSQ